MELVAIKRIGRAAPQPRPEPYPELLALLADAGLPVPVSEYVFASNRRFRLDYAYPSHRVGIEVEGGIWRRGGGAHSHPTNILRDIEKHNLLVLLGWRVIRATPDKFADAVSGVGLIMGVNAA